MEEEVSFGESPPRRVRRGRRVASVESSVGAGGNGPVAEEEREGLFVPIGDVVGPEEGNE